MAVASAADLVGVLRQLRLLEPEQLDDLTRKLQGKTLEPRALTQKLIQHGWLTPYQVNQLLQGKGQELVLGNYVLLERLGEGGMGAVFKARHRTMDRIVALKLIRKELLDSPQAVKRFHREIQAAAQLNHPNIVLAYDADQCAGAHFLTMEFVDGIDLAKVVKKHGNLGIKEACDYLRQAALGLQHAHEKGMVHRDIKPPNLLRTNKGVVKVLDMGLARIGRPEDDETESLTLTSAGLVMGTVDYMAPEQATNSHTVDIRADLYSLGCTFYFLLTGRVPFPGGDALSKMMKHKLDQPTPVEQLRPDIPPGVAALLRKLMAKQPEQRFQTPAQLAAVLAGGVPSPEAIGPAGSVLPTAIMPSMVPVPAPVAVRPTEAAPIPMRPQRRGQPSLLIPLIAALLLIALFSVALLFLLKPDNDRSAQAGTARTTDPRRTPTAATRALLTQPGRDPRPTMKMPDTDSDPPPPLDDDANTITNSIGLRLRYIEPGKFQMGTSAEDVQRFKKETNQGYQLGSDWEKNEVPQHEVHISRGFYLGVFEVTQGQYERVMRSNPSKNKGSHDLPVDFVSWVDATEFCRRLSDLADEKHKGRTYRLPTEAEWEYACRAGTTKAFHYGDTLSSLQANIDGTAPFGNVAKGDKSTQTKKVGSYAPNAWGLYDMHGNVWEWCADGPRVYGPRALEDPLGPMGPGGEHVLRGGGYIRGAVRSAMRKHRPGDTYRIPDGGFRVACDCR